MPEWAMNLGGVTLVQDNAAVTAADDLVTATAHGLSDGDLVMVDDLTGGASALVTRSNGGKYYARNVTADTFQISATRGGAVIDFASDGTADIYTAVPAYTAQDLRRLQAGILQRGDNPGGFAARAGVLPDGSVSVIGLSGSTWTTDALVAVVKHSTAGPYLVAHTGDTGSLDPADGTNPRIDALDLQVRDDDEDASGFRDSRVVYVAGTPASSPVAPAVTANAERLGTILVPAGGSPSPSVQTEPRFTVARGGVTPVQNTAAFPASGGRYEGMLLWNSEDDTLVANMNAGSTWEVIARASQPVKGWTPIANGEQAAGSGAFTVDITGGGKWPAGTFSQIKCYLQGDLDAVGTVRLRINSESTADYVTGLLVYDAAGSLDLNLHETGQQWILTSWATVSTNSCQVTIFGTDTTDLSYESTGGRPSTTASFHNTSRGWGDYNAAAVPSSLEFRPFSSGANTFGDEFRWWIEGYRP